MRISVITVVLNPEASLALTAQSVLQQDHGDVEWSVVDGLGWDPAGRALLDRYRDRMDRYVSAPDDGVYHAMNAAAAQATGDWIVFLNAGDVLFRADTLSRLVPHLQGDADIVYGDHDYMGHGQHLFRKAASAAALLARLRQGDLSQDWHARMPCHQATYYRRALLERMPFDTRYRIAADHDLFLRAARAGRRLDYVDQTLCRYAAGGMSARAAARCRAEWTDIYSRFSDDPAAVRRQFAGQAAADDGDLLRGAVPLGGTYPREGPYPAEDLPVLMWVRAAGLRIAVPRDIAAPALRLRGQARTAQDLTVMRDGAALATAALPEGRFDVTLDLSGPVARGTVLTLHGPAATPLGPTDARTAGWALFGLDLTGD